MLRQVLPIPTGPQVPATSAGLSAHSQLEVCHFNFKTRMLPRDRHDKGYMKWPHSVNVQAELFCTVVV